MEKDLFGNTVEDKTISVNIYSDESMNRKDECGNNWDYMCLIVEKVDTPLLEDIIKIRYMNNFNKESSFFDRNDKIIHWTDIESNDEKNICKRWFEYILNPSESEKKFFCYILGLNESLLNDDEFDKNNKFNSIYNRFFRSAIEYALKCFFDNKGFNVQNIYHEQGQQQHHEYFPWHPIKTLSKKDNICFNSKKIIFIGKDHREDKKSNIIQLCDCFLGAVTNIIHGIENMDSNKSKYKKELINLILPLVEKMTREPNNDSDYKHSNRIMIRFFPKEKTERDSIERHANQFYTNQTLKYKDDISGQTLLGI